MTTTMKSAAVTAAFALVALGSATATAQTPQVRSRTSVTIPAPDAAQLEQLLHQASAGQAAGEMARGLADMARSLADAGRQVGSSRDFRAEQTDRQTKTLAIGASGALELKNVIGDITVKAGSARDVKLEIVRIARGRTDADAKRGLTEVTAEVTQREGRASVTARYPSSRGERLPYAVSVAYIVEAPAGTSLTIGTTTGDVDVSGIKGEMTVDSVSGDVKIGGAGRVPLAKSVSGDVTLTDVDSDGTVVATTISGDIALQNVKARRLSIDVTSGDITARGIQAQNAEAKGISGGIEYEGPLAKGGRYEFQCHAGSVRLTVTGEGGFDIQARTFSGRVSVDGLREASRGSVRGTVGDGGADVTITTFSGNVTVTRRGGGR